MIWLIVILTVVSFLQGSFLPLNLLLIIILARSFLNDDRINFWLAFAFGLLLSLLSGFPLGPLSFFYLISVWLIYLIKRWEFASHLVIVFLFSVLILSLNQVIANLFSHSSFDFAWIFKRLLGETVLILPGYFLIKIWEERFIPRPDIKLKV